MNEVSYIKKKPFHKQSIAPLLSRAICMAALFVPLGTSLSATSDPAQICDHAARQVAAQSDVPLTVLRAITRTETGRTQNGSLRPWPWTVNMQGKGVWFDTEDQARVFVFRHFKKGARSFDIGCFQINYRWHHQGFNSIEEMFDPMLNARYAAQFLTKLRKELGSWDRAVGAYHSRTEKYAARYLKKFAAIRDDLSDEHQAQPAQRSERASPPARLGSLVPLNQPRARSIFDRVGG